MSAFMVSSKTIQGLAEQIVRKHTNRSWDHHIDASVIYGIIDLKSSHNAIDAVSEAMHCMNLEALRQRYGYETMLEFADYIDLDCYSRDFKNNWEITKAMHCFLYQCLEGRVPETALYKALENWTEILENHIVTKDEHYKAARWG